MSKFTILYKEKINSYHEAFSTENEILLDNLLSEEKYKYAYMYSAIIDSYISKYLINHTSTSCLDVLIKHNYNINRILDDKYSLIIYTIVNNNFKLFEYIIEIGNIDPRAIIVAANLAHFYQNYYFLDKLLDIEMFHFDIILNNFERLTYFERLTCFEYNYEYDSDKYFKQYLKYLNSKNVDLKCVNSKNKHLLYLLCKRNLHISLKYLLKNTNDFDYFFNLEFKNPLHPCIKYNFYQCFKLLIDYGQKNLNVIKINHTEYTLLHLIVENNNADFLNYAINKN